MKKLIIFALSMWCVQAASAQPIDTKPITQPHPRLLLLAGEEEVIRDKIARNDFLRRTHLSILQQSEEILSEPDLKRIVISDMLGVSRSALRQIYYLSYSYRMTGDERFARRAEQVMLTVCGFEDWHPAHFLDVAEMTAAVSIGYDWLYDRLAESTRETARKAIVEKGINESFDETASHPQNTSWIKKVNNWNPVCNTGLTFGAIATYEHNPELSKRVIDRAVHLVRNRALPEFLPDGNYPEGYSYWSYGTAYTVMLIDMLEKTLGSSFELADNPGFVRSPQYILHMSTQALGSFSYSDCRIDSMGLQLPMFWFADRLNDTSILWAEMEKIRYIDRHNRQDMLFTERFLPSLLMWSPVDFGDPETPSQRLFVGQGPTPVALLRNHWGGPDEIFVGLKAGTCAINHAHMDIGSFVMYRGENRWAIDAGIQSYNTMREYGITLGARTQESSRWKPLRLSPYLHNLMIFSDSLQRVPAKAYIDDWGDRPGFVFARTDLSSINEGVVLSYHREVSIVDDKYVVVRDEIANIDRDNPIRWAMLTPAEVTIVDENTALLTMNEERLYLNVKGKDISMQTWSTEPQAPYDVPNPGTVMVGFTATIPAGETIHYEISLIPEEVEYGLLSLRWD